VEKRNPYQYKNRRRRPEPTPVSLLCPPYNISCLSRIVKAVCWSVRMRLRYMQWKYKIENEKNLTQCTSNLTETHTNLSNTETVCTTENKTESRNSITNTFKTLWRSGIDINLKIDADALNRRRRRFCVRRTIYHIYQGYWRLYAVKCACVYVICIVKNKVENETSLTDCTFNLT
jgi:hypothetical protein